MYMFKSLLTSFLALVGGTATAPAQSALNHEALEELARQGVFKAQYVIPLQLEDHPLFVLLKQQGLFDLTGDMNQLMLPVERDLAARMGVSRYAATPLPSYLEGVRTQLDKIWAASLANDTGPQSQAALTRATKETVELQSVLKAALATGHLYVAD
ncbi:hypothetical protein [Mesorhizobium sp. CN2-181]|uniref:hypothetical protein n=1 Tax=Mesorhizobium yinganensis TaxID=3157707 RepID=UPI0032B72CE4